MQCDSLRTGRTLDLNDRAYFKRAHSATDAVIEAAFGRLTGIAVLQIAYPARDKTDALKYVLLASLNLEQFGSRIATASPYADMSVLIWDDKGTLMARLPDDGARKLAGTAQAQSALYGFVRAGQSGDTAELPGPEGTEKIWALSVLPLATGGGLRMTLGIPRDVLVAKADRDLARALSALAIGSLLAVLAALWFAEIGIRRHVARIAAAAARQGKGDFSARISAPYACCAAIRCKARCSTLRYRKRNLPDYCYCNNDRWRWDGESRSHHIDGEIRAQTARTRYVTKPTIGRVTNTTTR